MAILELFSTRRKRERGEAPDVFVYDALPRELRVQAIYIVHDALGQSFARMASRLQQTQPMWKSLSNSLDTSDATDWLLVIYQNKS